MQSFCISRRVGALICSWPEIKVSVGMWWVEGGGGGGGGGAREVWLWSEGRKSPYKVIIYLWCHLHDHTEWLDHELFPQVLVLTHWVQLLEEMIEQLHRYWLPPLFHVYNEQYYMWYILLRGQKVPDSWPGKSQLPCSPQTYYSLATPLQKRMRQLHSSCMQCPSAILASKNRQVY